MIKILRVRVEPANCIEPVNRVWKPAAFVYHRFDRIVINGYLTNLSRSEQVVYFFRQILEILVMSNEA